MGAYPELKDKVALVTGGRRGIGRGIALRLAKEGCDIISADMDVEGAQTTADEVNATGRKAIALKLDVSNQNEVNDMVKTALKQFNKIDILVNNAGGATPPSPFVEKPETDWDKDINLNLRGVMNCTKAVLPQMISRQSGKIVNISSVGGIDGVPTGSAYGAAKAGVINFTTGLAREVMESGINVNCIAPGLGATQFYNDFPAQMIELSKKMAAEGKATTPQDIGNVVAFLASDVSIRILGQCLRVSGTL